MTNEIKQNVEAQNVEVVKEKKVSKLAVLKTLLQESEGYTKEELALQTGLKLSTVNCQLYYHLPTAGFKIEKMEGKKVRFARG